MTFQLQRRHKSFAGDKFTNPDYYLQEQKEFKCPTFEITDDLTIERPTTLALMNTSVVNIHVKFPGIREVVKPLEEDVNLRQWWNKLLGEVKDKTLGLVTFSGCVHMDLFVEFMNVAGEKITSLSLSSFIGLTIFHINKVCDIMHQLTYLSINLYDYKGRFKIPSSGYNGLTADIKKISNKQCVTDQFIGELTKNELNQSVYIIFNNCDTLTTTQANCLLKWSLENQSKWRFVIEQNIEGVGFEGELNICADYSRDILKSKEKDVYEITLIEQSTTSDVSNVSNVSNNNQQVIQTSSNNQTNRFKLTEDEISRFF